MPQKAGARCASALELLGVICLLVFVPKPSKIYSNVTRNFVLCTTTKRYRTTPLRALCQHPPYDNNGEFATLAGVTDTDDPVRNLELKDTGKADLEELLKCL